MTTVLPAFERYVLRPAATLPQTGTGALFTISGGPVFASVVGRVTAVLGASVSLVKLVANPTVGTDSDLSSATSLSGVAALRWVGPAFFASTQALLISSGECSLLVGSTFGTLGGLVAPGDIEINTTGNQTGEMEWYCAWTPIVPGARVELAP